MTKPLKTLMPEDFKVTNDHRQWAVKTFPGVTYAWCLPDAMWDEFIRYNDERNEDGDPWKWVNWNRTFQNFIKNPSPLGWNDDKEWTRIRNRAESIYDKQFGTPERTSKPAIRYGGVKPEGEQDVTLTDVSSIVERIKARHLK